MIVIALLQLICLTASSEEDKETGISISEADAARMFKAKAKAELSIAFVKAKGTGSAVLLRVENKKAYFATCAHVLQDASSVKILCGDPPIELLGKNCQFYTEDFSDLAIIACDVDDATAKTLHPLGTTDVVPASDTFVTLSTKGRNAVCVGWPGISSGNLVYPTIQLLNIETGQNLDVIVGGNAVPIRAAAGDLIPCGVSGGPVVDDKLRFAGLMIGEFPGKGILLVPAHRVIEALDKCCQNPSQLGEKGVLQKIKLHYTKVVLTKFARTEHVDELDWSRISDSWPIVFGDASQLLEQFSEPSVDLRNAALEKAAIDITIDAAQLSEADVVLNLNGTDVPGISDVPNIPPKKEDGANAEPPPPTRYKLDLQPGENLLIVHSKLKRPSPHSLNEFLSEKHTMAFSVNANGDLVQTLLRTVPAVITDYSIFVTLLRKPNAAPAMDSFRVEIPLATLEKTLSQKAPVTTRWADPHGTLFKTDYAFRSVKLTATSEHRLNVLVGADLTLLSATLSLMGMTLEANQASFDLDVAGRIDFINVPAKPVNISLRAMAASGKKDFKIPLGGGNNQGLQIGLDVANLLRMALVSLLNQGFKNNTPISAANQWQKLLENLPEKIRTTVALTPSGIALERSVPTGAYERLVIGFSKAAHTPVALYKDIFVRDAKLVLKELELGKLAGNEKAPPLSAKITFSAEEAGSKKLNFKKLDGTLTLNQIENGDYLFTINFAAAEGVAHGIPKTDFQCEIKLFLLSNGELKNLDETLDAIFNAWLDK